MKRILALSLILLTGACGKTPDNVVTVQGATPDQTPQIVKDATKQLVTACIGLNQFSYDLTKKTWNAAISNNAGNPYNYHTERWGWTKWVQITVQVSPKAKDLPKEWAAPGKILTYDLGGGTHPGIASIDKLSQLMCGSMAVSNNLDDPVSHLDVAELSILDQLP